MSDYISLIITIGVAVLILNVVKGALRIILEIVCALFAIYMISNIIGVDVYGYVISMIQSFLSTFL